MSKQKQAFDKAKTARSWALAPRLGREVQGRIGEQLRELHEEIIQQGVPARFIDLLAKLDAKKADDSE